jgi:ABC-type glycerol-3-phosphate transport system permease component
MMVYMTVSIPFTVFLLTGFFSTIPTELEEASYIDGCNLFQTFYKIMLPIATPGLVTAAIFNSIILWNEYMMALIFITSKENKTLSLGLFGLQQALHYTGDWVAVFTACLLATIPTVLLYVLLAEKLVSGITVGAIKS